MNHVPVRWLYCLFSAASLILLLHHDPAAEPIDIDPLAHSSYGRELMLRGEYEKGIDHLRRAYLTFPLNTTLKRNLAEGYAASGNLAMKRNQYEQADEYFVKAQELYPGEAAYSLLRGICNYYLKRYDTAGHELGRAQAQLPSSAEVLYYLGLVEYERDNRPQAIELWEQAIRLSPGRREISDMLSKARRESRVENGMERSHSSRFDLTYDPGVSGTFALRILDVLETAANQIGAELGHFPGPRVPVAIYKRDDFKDVTGSPDWSGGIYDGRIRLPFGALNEITPAIRGVLFHEYAHVVIFDLTRGNCPLWLNEGIAEMFGRMQHNTPLPELGTALRSGTVMPFRSLETSFSGMAKSQAALAYQQSYALVNHMVIRYGWHTIRQILTDLGKGRNIDDAVSSALANHSQTYDGLTREWLESMKQGIGI